jgi:putative transposase
MHQTATILLVTVCSQDRKRIFSRRSSLDAVVSAWKAEGQWLVGRFILMPDHIHFFCAPGRFPEPRFDLWMRKWKARASRKWPVSAEHPIWQRGHWDRQLRDAAHYGERWDYVRANPIRAGLCENPDDWPWQGEIYDLVI